MLKWVQSGLSAVAGTAEPEYGRQAIYTVTDSIISGGEPISRSTTKDDFHWLQPGSTNVETQTFYFTDLTQNIMGFAQVIHSSVMSVHTTAQFTCRLYQHGEENLWTLTKLENFRIDGANFYADNLSFELNDDDKTYTLKSSVTEESIVELTVERLSEGVVFGKDGLSLYGDDKEQPWGSIRHIFWPRCSVVGTIKTQSKQYEIKGFTMFVMALQGMKPHHAAKAWNFLNFQSENFAAIQMEFTTPPSYATTKVNIGIVVANNKIALALINNEVVHVNGQTDDVGWPVPQEIVFKYLEDKREETPSEDDKVFGTVLGELKNLVERVDVMAEIPQFVKNIVSGVAGAKPYIYQYAGEFEIEVPQGKEKGLGYTEVTFISE